MPKIYCYTKMFRGPLLQIIVDGEEEEGCFFLVNIWYVTIVVSKNANDALLYTKISRVF